MSGFSFMKGAATSPIPLHRLNRAQTLIWLLGGQIKRAMATNLSKQYSSGVAVCSVTQRHISTVSPNGACTDLPPPHRYFEAWQFANAPKPPECPCVDFTDPENGGKPWRERGSELHHPLCQHERVSMAVFNDKDKIGVSNCKLVANRPDTWNRAREHYRGK